METHYFSLEGMACGASQLPWRQITVKEFDACPARAMTADFSLIVDGNRCMSGRRDPVTGIVKTARSAAFAHLAPHGDDLRPTVAAMAMAGIRADGPLTAAQMFALGNPGSVVEEATAAVTCRKVLALDVLVAPGLHRCWRRVAKTATSPERLVFFPGTEWEGRPDIVPEPVALCIAYSIMVASAPVEVDPIGNDSGDDPDAEMLCIDIDADTPPEPAAVASDPGWSPAAAPEANQSSRQGYRAPAEAPVHPAPPIAAPPELAAQPVPPDACPEPTRPMVTLPFVGFRPPISEMCGGAECHLYEAVLVIKAMTVVWFIAASHPPEAGPHPIELRFGVAVVRDDGNFVECACNYQNLGPLVDWNIEGVPGPVAWPQVNHLSLAAGRETTSVVMMTATLPRQYRVAANRGQLRVSVNARKFGQSTDFFFDVPIRIV